MKNDFYETLGISKNATEDEIKKAYRKQALAWHPDRNKTKEAEEKFKEINEAYEVLSDPQKKAAFDQYGHAAFEPGGMGNTGNPFGGGGFQQNGPFTYTYSSSSGNNPFEGFGGFSDPFEIFEQFFGGASPFGQPQRRKQTPTYRIRISFDEAVTGIQKDVKIGNRNRRIKIPAGIDDNQRIRFDDFMLLVEVEQDKRFQREGNDIYSMQEIPYSMAVIGGILNAKTVDDTVKVRIRPGTQSGTLIRLQGKGIGSGYQKGDHYVRIIISVPEKLSHEQKRVVEEMERAGL